MFLESRIFRIHGKGTLNDRISHICCHGVTELDVEKILRGRGEDVREELLEILDLENARYRNALDKLRRGQLCTFMV